MAYTIFSGSTAVIELVLTDRVGLGQALTRVGPSSISGDYWSKESAGPRLTGG